MHMDVYFKAIKRGNHPVEKYVTGQKEVEKLTRVYEQAGWKVERREYSLRQDEYITTYQTTE